MNFFNAVLARWIAALCCIFAASSLHAGLILNYDSLLPSSGGSLKQLTRIDRQTDRKLVRSSQRLSRLGSDVAGAFTRSTHPNMVGGKFANQNDLNFRFGSEPVGQRREYELPNRAVAASNLSGNYIEFVFTAAKDLELNEVAFRMFVNSDKSHTHGARDVGVFIDVNGGGFKQFDSTYEGVNSNNKIVTFNGAIPVDAAEVVTVRLVFADKTLRAQNFQAATRIGDVQIYAKEVDYTGIPEPSAYVLLLGLFSLATVVVRRQKRA